MRANYFYSDIFVAIIEQMNMRDPLAKEDMVCIDTV